ncbi:MAG: YraN family protein [Prolixibacteraceae bacterium]|jgi:putative endonuclease|nr:YraN family protein [Prolixibacteraceae bacterium]
MLLKTEKDKGKEGEKLAAEYLREQGYTILYCNWIGNHKELDIVCTKDNQLVVVEVKNRESWNHLDIRELIPPSKIKNIIDGTELFIAEKNPQKEVRFDVIIVNTMKSPPNIQHIVSAFNALDY